jgi:TolA-binding protein
MLLAQIGDFLLEKKQLDKAEPIFKYLMDEYPKSDVLDFAYNGLGEVAYQKKDYQRALKLFTDAVEKVGAQQKLRDVTVGRAKTLLAMDRLDDAKKLFEQIASVREWRGEATAFAVFSLGEIAEKKNDLAGAIANYQRVYVAYQRFLPWVAKAYIKSAECFEKLNKTQEAQNTYREMLRNDKLANFPETQLARKRVQEAG